MRLHAALILLLALAPGLGGCTRSAAGGEEDTRPFSDIVASERLHFTGAGMAWGGEVANGQMRYTTPDDPAGQVITVERFAGRGGVAFSGMLGARNLDMMVTPGKCLDGTSKRTYPLTVTLRLHGGMHDGCAWSDAKPFTDPSQAAATGAAAAA